MIQLAQPFLDRRFQRDPMPTNLENWGRDTGSAGLADEVYVLSVVIPCHWRVDRVRIEFTAGLGSSVKYAVGIWDRQGRKILAAEDKNTTMIVGVKDVELVGVGDLPAGLYYMGFAIASITPVFRARAMPNPASGGLGWRWGTAAETAGGSPYVLPDPITPSGIVENSISHPFLQFYDSGEP